MTFNDVVDLVRCPSAAGNMILQKTASTCLRTEMLRYVSGVSFFGKENNSYWVILEVKNAENKSVLASKAGWFSSGVLQSKLRQYRGFEVFFDTVVNLKRFTTYSIEASITGSDSCSGGNGFKSVKCPGVIITFTNSRYCLNGTSITRGQFPELLFSV